MEKYTGRILHIGQLCIGDTSTQKTSHRERHKANASTHRAPLHTSLSCFFLSLLQLKKQTEFRCGYAGIPKMSTPVASHVEISSSHLYTRALLRRRLFYSVDTSTKRTSLYSRHVYTVNAFTKWITSTQWLRSGSSLISRHLYIEKPQLK